MSEKVNYSAYGIKSKTKSIVLTASIMEIVLGILFLCFAGAVVFLGIGYMFMGQAWGQSIMEAFGFYGVLGAFVMALLVIYCIIAFLIFLIIGVLMTVSGAKTAHACKNPMTLISARKTILGYAIFYCVLIVIFAGLIPLGSMALGLAILIFIEALLLTITILKFVGVGQLPRELLTVGSPVMQPPVFANQYTPTVELSKVTSSSKDTIQSSSKNTVQKKSIKKLKNTKSPNTVKNTKKVKTAKSKSKQTKNK